MAISNLKKKKVLIGRKYPLYIVNVLKKIEKTIKKVIFGIYYIGYILS